MTIRVTDTLTSAGTFPLLDDGELIGGMRIVADDTELLAIGDAFIKQGMLIRVLSSANNGGADTYYENQTGVSGALGAAWTIAVFGGGGATSLDALSDVDTGLSGTKGDRLVFDGTEWTADNYVREFLVGSGPGATHTDLTSAVATVNGLTLGTRERARIRIDDTYNETDEGGATFTFNTNCLVEGMHESIVIDNAQIVVSNTVTVKLKNLYLRESFGGAGSMVTNNGTLNGENVIFDVDTWTCLDGAGGNTQFRRSSICISSSTTGVVSSGGTMQFRECWIFTAAGASVPIVSGDGNSFIFTQCDITGRVNMDNDGSIVSLNTEHSGEDYSLFSFTSPGANTFLEISGSRLNARTGTYSDRFYAEASVGTVELRLGGVHCRDHYRVFNDAIDTNFSLTADTYDANCHRLVTLPIKTTPTAVRDGSALLYDDTNQLLAFNFPYSYNQIGGFMSVDDEAARDGLLSAKLEDGMVSWVRAGNTDATRQQGFQRDSSAWNPISWSRTPYVVDTGDQSFPYSNLQDAIDDCPEGGTIFIQGNVFSIIPAVTITHSRLRIQGVQRIGRRLELPAGPTSLGVLVGGITWEPPTGVTGHLTLDGVGVSGTNGFTMDCSASATTHVATLDNCLLSSSTDAPVHLKNSTTDDSAIMLSNSYVFTDAIGQAAVLFEDQGTYHIDNCDIRSTSGLGVDIGASITFGDIHNTSVYSDTATAIRVREFNPHGTGNNVIEGCYLSNKGQNTSTLLLESTKSGDILTLKSNVIKGLEGIRCDVANGEYCIVDNTFDVPAATGYMIRVTAAAGIYHSGNTYMGDNTDVGARITSTATASFFDASAPAPSI